MYYVCTQVIFRMYSRDLEIIYIMTQCASFPTRSHVRQAMTQISLRKHTCWLKILPDAIWVVKYCSFLYERRQRLIKMYGFTSRSGLRLAHIESWKKIIRKAVSRLCWTVNFTLRKFHAVKNWYQFLTAREELIPIRHGFHTYISHVWEKYARRQISCSNHAYSSHR